MVLFWRWEIGTICLWTRCFVVKFQALASNGAGSLPSWMDDSDNQVWSFLDCYFSFYYIWSAIEPGFDNVKVQRSCDNTVHITVRKLHYLLFCGRLLGAVLLDGGLGLPPTTPTFSSFSSYQICFSSLRFFMGARGESNHFWPGDLLKKLFWRTLL